MKFEITHPKIWNKISERNIPMTNRIKIYEKLGGAYRLGESGGEQVFNKMTELLKHKLKEMKSNRISEAGDHEVSMAMGQLDDIIKNASELKEKIGSDEKDIAGWIQDHISQSQNFINQANTGYHELEGNA